MTVGTTVTWIEGRRFNPLASSSSRFEGRCGHCGLHTFASASGMIDGFFGRHQGADGSAPSCPVLR